MKITHSQTRTIQVKSYEPWVVSFTAEDEIEAKYMEKEMKNLKAFVDARMEEALAPFNKEKENS